MEEDIKDTGDLPEFSSRDHRCKGVQQRGRDPHHSLKTTTIGQ